MAQLVDWQGRPISSKQERNAYRRGEQVSAFDLPDGAIVSREASYKLHARIKDDPALREKLEVAARMTGRRSLHLALCDRTNSNVTAELEKAIDANLDFGETIQRTRIEKESLPATEAGYANLN